MQGQSLFDLKGKGGCCNEHLREAEEAEVPSGRMDYEIAAVLDAEGIMPARGVPLQHGGVHVLRKRWRIGTGDWRSDHRAARRDA